MVAAASEFRLKENGGPVVVRHPLPAANGRAGRLHGVPHVVRCGVGEDTEHGVLAVRLHHVDGFAATLPLFAPDRHGELGPLRGQLL
jgi:hypothetical protein